MEDGQTGVLIVAVAAPVGVVPKPGQEFATTRGPKTEVHIAAVLLDKIQIVSLKVVLYMEDGQNGALMVAVVAPVEVVPKPGKEFATTLGPKTEVHNAAVLLRKMKIVTLKLAVSFRFANYYLLDIK